MGYFLGRVQPPAVLQAFDRFRDPETTIWRLSENNKIKEIALKSNS